MAGEVEIRAPAEQTEGTRSQVLRWLKAVGDTVTENEPLIEIETDKVTVEVAAPGSGTLRAILKEEQDEIGPGELLGRIESESGFDSEPGTAHAAAAPMGGTGATGPAPRASQAGAPAEQTSPSVPTSEGSTPPAAADRSASISLSPAVRRLLAEHGLEASAVRGTGQGARVSVEDVLRHVAEVAGITSNAGVCDGSDLSASGSRTSGPRVSGPRVPGSAAAATGSAAESMGPSHRIPHSGVRRRIAEHMVQSLLHTAPHVTTVFEADLSAVLEHRQRNKEDFARRGAPLTFTAYFLQAAVDAIRAVPEANSRWTDTALEVFDSIHIGVGTALDTGLVVPVLRDVQSRDLFEIALGLDELVRRAREGRLAPADVRGGTFAISNHGVSGSLLATPIIINQPQSAILGLGRLEKRAVVVSDEAGDGPDRIVIRPRCYVTLTIDHRVMDGHQANRFLQTFVQRLATSHPQ